MVKRQEGGISLVELMIALVIVGVTLSIALPSYQAHRERTRTAVAIGDISAISSTIDRFQIRFRRFPADLDEVGLAGMLDPWGFAYRYLNIADADKPGKGKVRKDKNLVPINSDYDLYSVGPDGKSVSPLTAKPSRDDIVRANNGRFVGRAEDY